MHVNSLSHKEHKLTQDDVYRLDSGAKVIGDLKVIAVRVIAVKVIAVRVIAVRVIAVKVIAVKVIAVKVIAVRVIAVRVIAVKVGRCHVSVVKGELVVMMRDVERVNCRR